MAKSARTIALENELTAIQNKMTALNSALSSLNACKTKVKSTYNNTDSDHVMGNKYDDMYSEEQEAIKNYSDQLKAKKTEIKEAIVLNLASLSMKQILVSGELVVSRIMDAAAEATAEAKRQEQ